MNRQLIALLDDLHMNTNDYNNGMTIFYTSFLFAELPSQLVSKKVGPDNWIPYVLVHDTICQLLTSSRIQMVLWRYADCEGFWKAGRQLN